MTVPLSEAATRRETPTPVPLGLLESRSQVGNWVVDPAVDEISSQGHVIKLEPRTMRLLLYLMQHRERVVSLKELLDHVWANVVVTPQSVYSTVAQLRQALGDSIDSPAYIATVPRKGYRLLAAVTALPATPTPLPIPTTSRPASSAADIAATGALPGAPTAPSGPPAWSWRRRRWGLALVAALLGLLFLLYEHDRVRPKTNPETNPLVAAASIAVLPFLDLSEKRDAPYLADGMTEELIDILAHDPGLRVPARTSSFYFKGRTETVAAIAKQLNVANLLEGSVRRADGKIRVTARLIRASDGFHLWSETYTRDGDDVLAVEDDIAEAVAKILSERLSRVMPSATAERAPTASHNLSLECQLYRERNTVADAAKAVECFHRLIDMNPDSARVWAAYADALMRRPMLGDAAIDEQRAAGIESVKAARRALTLDPDSAAAHAVIANYLRIFEHDWDGAAREIKAALAADPDDPTTLLAATGLARDLGHLDEFIGLCERARNSDPLNFQPYARLAAAYLYLGRLEEAEAMARRRLDLSPTGSGSHAGLAQVLLARGQAQAALVETAQEPIDQLRSFGYAQAYYALGRRAEADSALNDIIARFSDGHPMHIAETLAFRGDIDRAFEFLDKAVASGDREVVGIKSNFYFRQLHADPRYRRILARLSLPASE